MKRSTDATPVPAMLCLCESSIPDTMGMLCCLLPGQHGVVCSRNYFGEGCGTERPGRVSSIPGNIGFGNRFIAPAFLPGCPVWVYAQTVLEVSMLQASVSLLCTDKRG